MAFDVRVSFSSSLIECGRTVAASRYCMSRFLYGTMARTTTDLDT